MPGDMPNQPFLTQPNPPPRPGVEENPKPLPPAPGSCRDYCDASNIRRSKNGGSNGTQPGTQS